MEAGGEKRTWSLKIEQQSKVQKHERYGKHTNSVRKSRQRKNNSTGLGLSIVKNLLQLHGFEYSFKNIENGVEFAIYMPIVSL